MNTVRFPQFLSASALLLLTLVLIPGGANAAASAKQFALGLGVNYASGDYGTDTTTRSVRVPLTLDYFPTEHLDFELIVPFLYQSNGSTTASGGMHFPTGRGRGGAMQSSTTSSSSSSQSGLGDITLTTGYLLQKETATRPGIRPLLYLKFPTGDKDKGLGTGEFDIGAGIGLVKWFGPWYSFAEGRYIFQGSNAALGLKDYATFEGEVGYLVSKRFLPSLDLWWSTPPADAASDQVEARLKGNYWLTETVRLEPYIAKGLSSQSADYGAGLALFFLF